MKTTLEYFLKNQLSFSDQLLKKIGETPIVGEKFYIERQKKENILENIKKFFSAKSCSILDGEIEDSYCIINKDNEIVAVFSFIKHMNKDLTYINLLLLA